MLTLQVGPNSAVKRGQTGLSKSPLSTLEQLRGWVRLQNSQQALRFVRFRTSRKYCYNWQSIDTPQEIVSFLQCTSADFADTGGSDATGLFHGMESGRYGLLSDRAYQMGKFTPLRVRKVPSGYEIVRWVCIYRHLEGIAVQQWQETVGLDGRYRRVVLKSSLPPKLPGTKWFLYGLK